jgi:glycosyltransferase involved in cell wall biosynthesis
MLKRKKVLISAYACNPNKGSEAGVGWGWVSAIAKYHDLWVIIGELHRIDVEKEIAKKPDQYKNVCFYFLPRIRWLKLERLWPPAYLWTYRLWQREVYELAGNLHEQIKFDIVHVITYVGFRVPGHLWKLNTPFVWGPIGGLENTPWCFLPMLGLKGYLYFSCRNILNSVHKRFSILPKRAFRKTNGGTISATGRIRKEIIRWYGHESKVICEIGPPSTMVSDYSVREPGELLRLSWSGLHLPGKALPLLLNALAMLPKAVDWRLEILGEGACTKKWKRLSDTLKIDNRCTWHGWLPREKAMAIVHVSHVFVITSIKDLTSTVTLEALSQGVPVVCPDHCGFSDVITSDCGIKVPVKTPRQFEYDLSEALKRLFNEESERRRLACGALRRINDFSWDKKAIEINKIYQAVTDRE